MRDNDFIKTHKIAVLVGLWVKFKRIFSYALISCMTHRNCLRLRKRQVW